MPLLSILRRGAGLAVVFAWTADAAALGKPPDEEVLRIVASEDSPPGEAVRFATSSRRGFHDFHIDPSGRFCAVANGWDLRVWDDERADVEVIETSTGHAKFAFSPADGALASLEGGEVVVRRHDGRGWATVFRRPDLLQERPNFAFIRYSPDGARLLLTSIDPNLQVFDARRGESLGRVEGLPFSSYTAAFSESGAYLAICPGGHPTIWKWPDPKPIVQVKQQPFDNTNVEFFGDDHLLCIYYRGDVLYWRHVPTGKTWWERLPERTYEIAVSPDRGLFAFHQGCDVVVRDLASGKDLARVRSSNRKEHVGSVGLSRGGGRMIVGQRSTSTLWDLPALVHHQMTESENERELQLDDDGLWKDLASARPQEAFRASWKLAGRGEDVVGVIEKKLAGEHPTPAKFSSWMKTLAEGDAAAQDAAEEKIRAAAWRHVDLLRRGIEAAPTFDSRTRLQIALALLEPLPLGKVSHPQMRRAVRVVRLLEVVRTPEARKLIAKLAEVEAATVRDVARGALVRWPDELAPAAVEAKQP